MSTFQSQTVSCTSKVDEKRARRTRTSAPIDLSSTRDLQPGPRFAQRSGEQAGQGVLSRWHPRSAHSLACSQGGGSRTGRDQSNLSRLPEISHTDALAHGCSRHNSVSTKVCDPSDRVISDRWPYCRPLPTAKLSSWWQLALPPKSWTWPELSFSDLTKFLSRLGSGPDGLTSDEAVDRFRRFGPNPRGTHRVVPRPSSSVNSATRS